MIANRTSQSALALGLGVLIAAASAFRVAAAQQLPMYEPLTTAVPSLHKSIALAIERIASAGLPVAPTAFNCAGTLHFGNDIYDRDDALVRAICGAVLPAKRLMREALNLRGLVGVDAQCRGATSNAPQ